MTDDDIGQSQRNWLSTLHNARENCREKVATAMVAVPDPNRVTWPIRSPAQGQGPHRAAMEGHVSVIDYHDQISPYQDENSIEEIWSEALMPVSIMGGDEETLSLDKLEEWEFRFVHNTVKRESELHGERTDVQAVRVLLPVTGMRACYRQLNRAVNQLGFAAEADTGALPKGKLRIPQP